MKNCDLETEFLLQKFDKVLFQFDYFFRDLHEKYYLGIDNALVDSSQVNNKK